MPAKSKKQQRFFGIVHALQKGDIDNYDVSDKVKNVANKISKKDAKDFAKTKHKGLPNMVKKESSGENMKNLKFRQIIREQIKNILSEEYTELMRINSKDIEQIIMKYKKWEKASFENYGDFENKKTGESWNTKDAKIEILEFVYKQLNMISENNDKIIIK